MDTSNKNLASTVAPTVEFLYAPDGRITTEMNPLSGPLVEAFIKGEINTDEYSKLSRQQAEVNQRLRDFMFGDQPPDFMPAIPRAPRLTGWLRNILRLI